jgi:hypothetical protein
VTRVCGSENLCFGILYYVDNFFGDSQIQKSLDEVWLYLDF